MRASAYLHFDGNCEEAFGLYAEVFGGEVVTLARWAEMPSGAGPGGAPPAGMERKVMHALLKLGETGIMGSDLPPGRYVRPAGFGVALNVDSSAEVERIAASLGADGEVTMAPAETFFAHRFASVTDRFGVHWLIVHARG